MSELKIMTLNMKNNASASFQKRAASIENMVRWHDPDIIGTQEFQDHMTEHLSELSDAYMFYGKARGSYGHTNERCCILLKKERFQFLEGETFWLSSTPEVPSSSFIYSVFPRIATRALLKDRVSGCTFTFANTHLDHILPSVRRKQAEVLRDRLKQVRRGDFTVVTGDFNSAYPGSAVLTLVNDPDLCLKDTVPSDGISTLRNFIQSSASRFRPIDHILISNHLEVVKSEIITGMYMGRYPSDHYPVLTIASIPDAVQDEH